MTKYLIAALTIAFFTGCPRTGIDPIDNSVQGRKTCERSFMVTNASSNPVNIHMNIFEATMDAHCDGLGADQQILTVPAGQTATVKANMSCTMCEVNENYSVDSTDPRVTFSGSKQLTTMDGDSGTENALCTDTGCSGS